MKTRWMIVLLSSTLFGGCPSPEDKVDPAEEACELVHKAPVSITASDSPETAPALEADATAVIALSDSAPSYVMLTLDEPGDGILFLDTEEVLQALYRDGVEEPLGTPSPNAFCDAELPEHYDIELESGPVVVAFAPSVLATVTVVFTEAGDHGHDG